MQKVRELGGFSGDITKYSPQVIELVLFMGISYATFEFFRRNGQYMKGGIMEKIWKLHIMVVFAYFQDSREL